MSLENSEIFKRINECDRQRFTGILHINEGDKLVWNLYFFLGRFSGNSHGIHPLRGWRRQIQPLRPDLIKEDSDFWQENDFFSGNHLVVENLIKKNLINNEEGGSILQGALTEVLFDILQREEQIRIHQHSSLVYTLLNPTTEQENHFPGILIKVERIWPTVVQQWQSWYNANLLDYSPNIGLKIEDDEALQKQVSPNVYQKLSQLIQENYTLRDIALALNKEQTIVAKSIINFSQNRILNFREVPDYLTDTKLVDRLLAQQEKIIIESLNNPPKKKGNRDKPLIIHIDDNPMYIRVIQEIVTKAGYEYISVEEPLEAFPVLLKNQPDLIFLDLVMPIVSGYELCSQLRRIPMFQNLPIIIVTTNDGVIDRVRAKMVNATGFIAKPVDENQVLHVLEKYLPLANKKNNH